MSGSSTTLRLLADAVLILHVGVVLFVVGGLLLVIVGNLRGWRWINALWFRLAHLAAIAVVVAEAWLGLVCPLTTLEMWLRAQAGTATYGGGFIEHWLQRLLYWDAPAWVFVLGYTLFGLLVVASWWAFPPRPLRGGHGHASPSKENAAMADPTSDDHEVLNVRVFAVPRARLFEAWTDPAQLARWWGPKGFRNSFSEFDPRSGGHWRYVMHGPDGSDYPNHSVFVEVMPHERIVFDHLGDHLYRLTASLADMPDGGTELRFHMRFEKAHDAALRSFILDANEQNLDRLQAVLDDTA